MNEFAGEIFYIASGIPLEVTAEADRANADEDNEVVRRVTDTGSETTASDIPPIPVINAAKASPVEYNLNRIVRHVKVNAETHYVFRWYS